MQLSLVQVAFLLLLPALAASGSTSARQVVEQGSPVTYDKLPGIRSEQMVVEQNEAAQTLDKVAYTEEATSALHAETAENSEKAAASVLITKHQGLNLKTATMQAIVSAQRAAEMQKRAEASVKRARQLVSEMPAAAVKSAGRAVDAVVQGAIFRMDQEATTVAEEQLKLERKLAREAAKDAQIAALPWQQAKMRSEQTMVSYISQARNLGNAVTHLRVQAPVLSKQAGILQRRGDVVRAQEHQIAAKDLLDKAGQLASQADSFSTMANKINGGLGMYDVSASAAASYASYTANPGGGVGGPFPPLPAPLKLLKPVGGPASPA